MRPEPLSAVQCAVCGDHTFAVICPATELRAHREYLRRFYCRRLRPDGELPRHVLADRVDFTQDYATDIVACTSCGLVFHNPYPTVQASAYVHLQDYYGPHRLAAPRPTSPLQIAPWFDVCYRQSLQPETTRVSRFNVSLPFPLLPAVA